VFKNDEQMVSYLLERAGETMERKKVEAWVN